MKYAFLIFLSLCMVACGKPIQQAPVPTPASIFLNYPPYLQPFADRVFQCAEQSEAISLFTNPDQAAITSLPGPLIHLFLGELALDNGNIYQIGEETIQIIINEENPVSYLSTEEIQAIYTGQWLNWESNMSVIPIQVWTYPANDPLRTYFENALPGNSQAAAQTNIAPDPSAIMEAVAADPSAIAYLPTSWLETSLGNSSTQIKTVALEPTLTEKLIQPVLISVLPPLTPQVRSLLVCLQNPDN